ncbi:MAG: hypothetical protein REI78_02785 [Pedobacter sp.]|nr:hypothetical protein [Pedobacter sp.]
MLQQFSWGQFLVASTVLNLVWYVFVVLVFYRKEALAFLGGGREFQDPSFGGSGKAQPFTQAPDHGRGREIEEEVDAALIGSSRLPDGVEVRSSSQVSFSASEEDARYDQVGLVADVVQELKLVFSELESSGGSKADFFRKVEVLKDDFGGIGGHPSLGAINGFIRERALFPISDAELDELWY